MKNFFKFLGIIALVAVIGFSMAGCKEEDNDGGGSSFDGTWKNDTDQSDTITINNPNWTRTKGDVQSGTLNYESAESPDKPNIRNSGGDNIGTAQIVDGKLHWYIYSQGTEVIFSK